MIKTHSTNYTDTLIAISPDSDAQTGIEPTWTEKPSLARRIFDKIAQHPYAKTSDEVLIEIKAENEGLSYEAARDAFYEKGQACLRSSLLVKKYGWGVHFNSEQKVALLPVNSEQYTKLQQQTKITTVLGMRSKRKQ